MTATITAFNQFALDNALLKALDDVGYETPSPIQAQTIPILLAGKDVIGQAQTGTGKTAAFALPILSNLNLTQKEPQVLVLTPTRELAIQVAEAFQKYATYLKGFQVLPIYGGQDYRGQIRTLKRGVHLVVGTPGRVMDHMRRATLKLDNLVTLVLDEADEMLRMGFIDDVEWILSLTPKNRQIALFSATMPAQIRRIATQYLNQPENITVKVKTATADTIRQRFWPVSGVHKLDALTRILEAETFDAMLIFVRTKTATVDLSEKLAARGYASMPLNGDIPQRNRERTVEQLKRGTLDIIVATDVAARGLDVGRISHVVNYDIPYDTEAYIHRIGRTGRAGKTGDAILFVAPREKRMLHVIERATRQSIARMEIPSTEIINNKRIAKFTQRITDALASGQLGMFQQMIEQYQQEHNVPALDVAAALAYLLQGETPLLLRHKPSQESINDIKSDWGDERRSRKERSRHKRESGGRGEHGDWQTKPERKRTPRKKPQYEQRMVQYRIEVGHKHEVKPANICGAIANEADIESQYIGRIDIHDEYSLLDLPEGMPREILKKLKKVWVSGQRLHISAVDREKGKFGKASDADKRTDKKRKVSTKDKSKTKALAKAKSKKDPKKNNKKKTKNKSERM